ncbi:MAG: TetR/AcrR family transcriptional regulator [Oscillospiraceae bacterium]|nr:TetR/AcrR family transcriptional regulator [Oscillospiraceae bacterium]
MDEELGSASVREQLIKAGIAELEAHGIADFSLRRVAAACNISCAAPYKHFKSKEMLIDAIFDYIKSQLNLLLDQVAAVYREPKICLTESCMAYIRFCIANPHFRAVLMLSGKNLPLAERVKKLILLCFPDMEEKEREDRGYVVRCIAYGAALLLESGELDYIEPVMKRIKENIMRELEE